MHRPSTAELATRPIINRAPNTHPNEVPRSRTVDRAAMLIPDTETASEWTPYGTFYPEVYRGGYDGLDGRLMQVAQAGIYDPSANAWPNNAQWDRPNGFFANLLRLKPDTSAHPGKTMPAAAPGPTMLYKAPPIFSVQTQPIIAVGV